MTQKLKPEELGRTPTEAHIGLIQALTPAEILKIVDLYNKKKLHWLYDDGHYNMLHGDVLQSEKQPHED